MYNQTKGIFTAFGARHVKGVAITRGVVAICFVVATVVLLALGHWWGVFFVLPSCAERLARLPGPTLEPASGLLEDDRDVGVGLT